MTINFIFFSFYNQQLRQRLKFGRNKMKMAKKVEQDYWKREIGKKISNIHGNIQEITLRRKK